MTGLLTIFVAGFIRVFAAGFQSRNVNTGRIRSAAVTSFIIALSEGAVIVQIAIAPSWASRVVYGFAGALGIVAAMLVHDRVFDRRKAAG